MIKGQIRHFAWLDKCIHWIKNQEETKNKREETKRRREREEKGKEGERWVMNDIF